MKYRLSLLFASLLTLAACGNTSHYDNKSFTYDWVVEIMTNTTFWFMD